MLFEVQPSNLSQECEAEAPSRKSQLLLLHNISPRLLSQSSSVKTATVAAVKRLTLINLDFKDTSRFDHVVDFHEYI